MQFEATPEFLSMYESLVDREVRAVNEVLERLRGEHASRWARQGRIRGQPEAWIIVDGSWRLYWNYRSESAISLLALVRRDNDR